MKKKPKQVPLGEKVFAAFLWNNAVSAHFFFPDYVSMRSHLLDCMFRFLKHALPLEIFGTILWVFQLNLLILARPQRQTNAEGCRTFGDLDQLQSTDTRQKAVD